MNLKTVFAVVLSLALHVWVLQGLPRSERPTPVKKYARIRVKVVPPQDQPLAIEQPTHNATAKVSPNPISPKKFTKKKTKKLGQANKKPISDSPPRKNLNYAKLLSLGGKKYSSGSAGNSKDPTADRYSEGLNTDFRVATRYTQQTNFIRGELDSLQHLPLAFMKTRTSASAEITLYRKKSGKWMIRRATGEPYLKAFIYERIYKLIQRKDIVEKLDQTDMKKVHFRYRYFLSTKFKPSSKEWEIKSYGNIFNINHYISKNHDEWSMVGATGGAAPSAYLNILGTAFYAVDKLTDWDNHPDLLKLKESPAFKTSLFKFD